MGIANSMDDMQEQDEIQSGLTGWIKLHRQIVDSAVFQDEHLLRLWIWLLSKARHSPGFHRLDSIVWIPGLLSRSKLAM